MRTGVYAILHLVGKNPKIKTMAHKIATVARGQRAEYYEKATGQHQKAY